MAITYPYSGSKQGVQLPFWTIAKDGVPDQKTDPLSAYRYMEGRRKTMIDAVRQRPLLRLWDKNHMFLGQIAQEQSVMVEELMTDSGGGNITIRRDNWLSNFILYDRRIEEDLHFTLDPVPTNQDWRTRWGGKITTIDAKRSKDGLHTVEMEMVSNREHVKHLLAGCNPVMPPEIQFPRMWMMPWNCRTNLMISMALNLARQFFPLLAIPDNIANPFAWLQYGDAGILEGFNPLWWPIQPQFVNVATDQSRFEIFSARWTDFHTAAQPILDDAGCMIRAYTWLTTDKDSPHPELAALGKLARPWRNAIILAVEDKSGVTGPTGTFIDGFINAIAATADNMITDTILVNDIGPDGVPNPLFRKWFLVAPAKPWVVFRDGDYSGIVESERIQHGATAKTMMTGGKSPTWVNQLQTFAIKYGLAELSDYITAQVGVDATATASDFGYQAPMTPGLEEIYQGQFDDILLAYQRFTNPIRAIWCGDMGFLEHFEQGTGTGWTVATELTLRDADWKTRAYNVFKVTIRNGAPYLYSVDFNLGDRVSFEIGGVYHTDQVSAARIKYDKDSPVTVELVVGNRANDEDPFAMATRTLAGVWNMFGMFMGAKDLF